LQRYSFIVVITKINHYCCVKGIYFHKSPEKQ
jgi:hypothetical protein